MTENKLCFGDVFISVEMKTEKQKNANYQKVLEKEIGYDSDFLYGFNEYQKGKYIYGVVNIWEEDGLKSI